MKNISSFLAIILLSACSGIHHQAKKLTGDAATQGDPTQANAARSLFDFSSSFQNSGSLQASARWKRSATEAISESRRTALPLLILLTHQMSQPGAELETMLGGVPELGNPDTQRFVLLRVDYADQNTAHSEYYLSLKKRYQPHGFPVLLVTLPDGTEVARQTGYSSEWKSRTTQWINYAAEQSKKRAGTRRKEMEKFGYRMWSDRQGTQVWARLEKVDANQAVFISEWGEPFRTFISRLSDADQARLTKKAEG
ncbi:MAG: hypothetical protein WCN98_04350 [Verrucomicrobiaceae bacterium]